MKAKISVTNERNALVVNDRARALFMSDIAPHLDDALSLARWLTGSRADAQDVVQDACLRALNSVEARRGERPRAWLLAIVRNCAFTWLGKNRPKDLVVSDDSAEIERRPDAAPDAEAALIARCDAARLDAAIMALPPHLREVIVMREVNGLDYRAIAQACGTPVGTVMSRLSRARAKLIAGLGETTGSRRT